MIRSLATSAIALIAGAAPVLADLTPAQVWDSVEQYYSEFGYQVSVGSRDETGNALTVTDIVLKPAVAQPGAEMSVTIPRIEMHQTGDAKVRMIIDGDVVIDSTTPVPDADPVVFDATISMPGNELIASGTPEDMLLDLTYPTIKLSANFDDVQSAEGGAPLTAEFSDVKGHQQIVGGAEPGVTYDLTSATLDLRFDALESAVEEGQQRRAVKVSSRVEGLAMSGQVALPAGQTMDPQAMHTALAAGMAFDGKMSMATIKGDLDYKGISPTAEAENGAASFTSEDGQLAMAMSADGMTYGGSAKNVSTSWTQSDLPFPLSYEVADLSGSIQVPLMQSEDLQPFALTYKLGGLTLADAIWNMFDPQTTMPRDPASLTIDLQGQALVQKDLLDPALAEEISAVTPPDTAEGAPAVPVEDMPLLPKELTINKIALDAIGARADVSGKLNFGEDPSKAFGTLEGSFTGINGLIERLGTMGVLPQQQMMAVRMMLAMFAKTDPGNDDQMHTKLELREDGSIFANGQQVK
jgi:hypothetical protein